tara:strand:+ start:4966 stop:5373 length:408 start_codon:yes stop_codon:yes gene_type:complete
VIKELLDLAPDGYNIGDLGIDTTMEFICKFCDKEFMGDADEMQFYNYNVNYGCGCIPEQIVDVIRELKVKPKSIIVSYRKPPTKKMSCINDIYLKYYTIQVIDIDNKKHKVELTCRYDELNRYYIRSGKSWKWHK